MRYLISAFSFYNNRTTIAMFNGLVQIFKFFQQRSGGITQTTNRVCYGYRINGRLKVNPNGLLPKIIDYI